MGNGRSYGYYTQVMQAETLASAYRLWRRNWKGRGREYTAGALVWQVRPRCLARTRTPAHARAPPLDLTIVQASRHPPSHLDAGIGPNERQEDERRECEAPRGDEDRLRERPHGLAEYQTEYQRLYRRGESKLNGPDERKTYPEDHLADGVEHRKEPEELATVVLAVRLHDAQREALQCGVHTGAEAA